MIKGNELYRSNIVKNVKFGFFSRIILASKAFILTPLILTCLGSEGFGYYQLLLSIFGIASFITVGLSPSITYAISGQLNLDIQRRRIFSALNVFYIFFFIIIITSLFLDIPRYINHYFETNIEADAIYVSLYLTIAILILSISDSIRAGLHQHNVVTMQTMVATIMQFVGVWGVLVYFDGGIWELVVVTLGSTLLMKIYNIVSLYTKYRYFFMRPKNILLKDYKDTFKIGGAFFLIQLSIYVSAQAINLVIAKKVGSEHIALFQVNNLLLLTTSMFFGLYTTPLASALHSLKATNDITSYNNQYNKAKVVLLGTSILFALGYYIISPLFIELWVGRGFILDSYVTLIISFNILLTAFTQLLSCKYSANEKFNLLALGAMIQVLTLVTLTYLFLDAFGVKVVFYCQCVSFVFYSMFLMIHINKGKL